MDYSYQHRIGTPKPTTDPNCQSNCQSKKCHILDNRFVHDKKNGLILIDLKGGLSEHNGESEYESESLSARISRLYIRKLNHQGDN